MLIHKDHPRRCGENVALICVTTDLIGSPPQVRGKRSYFPRHIDITRITPAGAGKTTLDEIADWEVKDHPRRCGENYQRPLKYDQLTGSPPQVRGKPAAAAINALDKRITPAGAGKTTQFRLLCK